MSEPPCGWIARATSRRIGFTDPASDELPVESTGSLRNAKLRAAVDELRKGIAESAGPPGDRLEIVARAMARRKAAEMSPRERGRRFDWRYRGFWDLIRSPVLKAAASAETTPERAQRLVELLAGEAA